MNDTRINATIMIIAIGCIIAIAFLFGCSAQAQTPKSIWLVAPPNCVGATVPPGIDTIQTVITANANDATLCFSVGVYRITAPVNPKPGQQLVGITGGTIITGAQVVTGFTPTAGVYVATGFLPASPSTYGECTTTGCSYAQDVFKDGAQLARVLSQGALLTGTFYEDFTANKIYLFDDPTGHTIEQSYASGAIVSTNTGVTVRNMLVEMTANSAQAGAIHCLGSAGWLITEVEVRFAHGAGVECASFTLTRSHIHHNGQLGIGGTGAGDLIDTVEIDHNNTAGYTPGWEAGGVKIVAVSTTSSAGTMSNNNSHDNAGAGLWCDINCYDWRITNNTVRNNTYGGIFYEISDKAVISGNTLSGNGTATPNGFYLNGDITVSASPNVEVFNNTSTSVVGIGGLQQNRVDTCTYGGSANYPDGTAVCPGGSHRLSNLYVHDNSTAPASGSSTLLAGISTDSDNNVFTSYNNRFLANTYTLRPSGSFFTWNNAGLSLAQWQALGLQ